MKRILLIAILALIGIHITSAQVGIGTEAPDASAQLELQSTTKGFLPPRMTEDDRDQINSPAQGLMIYCTNCGSDGEMQVYNGTEWTNMTGSAPTAAFACGDNVTFTYNGSSVTYGTIAGAGTNCWLDRNLGASQLADSSEDYLAYGDLYQWGRGADGHQTIVWTSKTGSDDAEQTNETIITSSSTAPGTAFITGSSNWYTGSNPDDLWKEDGTGVNNPCPAGFRVPTDAEWDAERGSWNTQDADGAFGSPLKLPMAGFRYSNGSLGLVGTDGFYWSSTVSGSYSPVLVFNSSSAKMLASIQASGRSVRCFRD